MNAASGNLFINSGDGVGSVSLNCGLIVDDTLSANGRIIIQSRNDNTNVGTINSTNNQSDWQNLVASSGQFTVCRCYPTLPKAAVLPSISLIKFITLQFAAATNAPHLNYLTIS